jgi:hypothetical protein
MNDAIHWQELILLHSATSVQEEMGTNTAAPGQNIDTKQSEVSRCNGVYAL